MRDHYQSYGSVMLMKDFDDKETHFREKFTEENLENFVRKESLPLVIQYEPGSAGKVLNSESKLHFLLVSNLDDKEHKERIEQVQTVAKNYKDEILFIHVDLAQENLPMLRLLVVTEDVPAMYLYNITDGARYLLTGEVTVENIDTFIQEYKQGNLKRGLVTGELPDPSVPETIKTLALQNLAPAVHQSEKSLFVFMYAPWCEKCKKESETWNSIGEQFKDSKHIQIAKMDIINNELIYFDVLDYPTIAWVPANDTEFRKYYGKRDLETLETYIKEVEKYEEKALRKRLRKELREKMKLAETVGSKTEIEKEKNTVKEEEKEPGVKRGMPEVEVLEPEEEQEAQDLEEDELEVQDAEDKEPEVVDSEDEEPEVIEPEEEAEVLDAEEEDPEVLVVDLPESSSQIRDEF
ncbi:protein disulfide-isomerase [Eurytemora carolleeae]|uniref:protein disulfide-isomerase n=1 Tax=Eurytemora carolleeae TaxID=1294199 RepID=UPI000C774F80|nr:protein disulfide-isomerase [Eurytemora carolleeae]|eukprot:XP_023328616.1 protein disulfide-isomerase-like [Eurytemora affinis]